MTNEIAKTFPTSLKAIKTSAVLLAIAATSAIAPAAFADSGHLVEQKLTVKIAASDLSTADGVQKAYEKLQNKATSFCNKQSASLDYLDETVEDCVQDLMEQFVKTSGATSLETYHAKMAEVAAPKQLAMN